MMQHFATFGHSCLVRLSNGIKTKQSTCGQGKESGGFICMSGLYSTASKGLSKNTFDASCILKRPKPFAKFFGAVRF